MHRSVVVPLSSHLLAISSITFTVVVLFLRLPTTAATTRVTAASGSCSVASSTGDVEVKAIVSTRHEQGEMQCVVRSVRLVHRVSSALSMSDGNRAARWRASIRIKYGDLPKGSSGHRPRHRIVPALVLALWSLIRVYEEGDLHAHVGITKKLVRRHEILNIRIAVTKHDI
eukprot:266411-Prorocentrum_minimum.AAC.1